MSDTPDLDPADFVYQSDQELFLVVTGETENSYQFAVHGWREIDKDRLDEYISHDNGKLFKEEDVVEVIEEDASDDQRRSFDQLQLLFDAYADRDFDEDGPHVDFSLEDS
jgi:hypothetical protein